MSKISKILMISVLAVFLAVGSVMAVPFNDNRPLTLGSSSEDSLQTVFNNTFGTNVIDAYNDQSTAALWTPAEAAVDSYLITLLSAASGSLGIYSTTGSYAFDLGSDNAVSFNINDSGDLWVDGDEAIEGFGQVFGFCWASATGVTSYTEDDKNAGGYGTDNNILALTYVVPDGASALLPEYQGGTTVNLQGDNDWVLAFEDTIGGDEIFRTQSF